jgi:hypothetical protein
LRLCHVASGVAYLCLVAQAVGTIDPDVLCENLALLVQLHVFGQLRRENGLDRSWQIQGRLVGETYVGDI